MQENEKKILCPDLKLFKIGKVRQVYDFKDKLLIVATDAVSVFDEVLDVIVPHKGEILTKISKFWFDRLDIAHHMISTNIIDFPEECLKYKDILEGRSMLVWKTEPFAIESIVRGYLYGSGYKDYLNTGEICGIPLQEGLKKGNEFFNPIFTPSIKRDDKDENVSETTLLETYNTDIIKCIREESLRIYNIAREYAKQKEIIIADTKFEFGCHNGKILLIDEILTPDSSRYWNTKTYQQNYLAGQNQESYDKQIIRDYLADNDSLNDAIINETSNKYYEIYNKLTA
jgi:phosphoribosylaminoimidazole-succinocarboxamide synthase